MDRLAWMLEDQALMSRAKNYFAWQARLILPELGRRVVEVGCGTGNFTGKLLNRELVVAIDIEPECVERLRARFPDQPNLHTFVCRPDCADFTALARFAPDCCVCMNVLEHIEDDCLALRNMAAILPRGGVIVLLVPAFPALFGPIDANLSHRRRYTAASLKALAGSCGLEIRRLRYMNSAGFFAWWINARLLRKTSQSRAQIAWFDRGFVPILSRIEAVVSPPFGQSLIAVFKKG